MLFGYARVSTDEQDLKRQTKELQEFGVLKENIREVLRHSKKEKYIKILLQNVKKEIRLFVLA